MKRNMFALWIDLNQKLKNKEKGNFGAFLTNSNRVQCYSCDDPKNIGMINARFFFILKSLINIVAKVYKLDTWG